MTTSTAAGRGLPAWLQDHFRPESSAGSPAASLRVDGDRPPPFIPRSAASSLAGSQTEEEDGGDKQRQAALLERQRQLLLKQEALLEQEQRLLGEEQARSTQTLPIHSGHRRPNPATPSRKRHDEDQWESDEELGADDIEQVARRDPRPPGFRRSATVS